MTEEDKELLLTDLCARLPYRPKGVKLYGLFDPKDITIIGYTGRFVETVDDEIEVERVRLYLRPMSSMTEEERLDLASIGVYIDKGDIIFDAYDYRDISLLYIITPYINWLNQHHFDYRDLISKGLALEAPKDMYI